MKLFQRKIAQIITDREHIPLCADDLIDLSYLDRSIIFSNDENLRLSQALNSIGTSLVNPWRRKDDSDIFQRLTPESICLLSTAHLYEYSDKISDISTNGLYTKMHVDQCEWLLQGWLDSALHEIPERMVLEDLNILRYEYLLYHFTSMIINFFKMYNCCIPYRQSVLNSEGSLIGYMRQRFHFIESRLMCRDGDMLIPLTVVDNIKAIDVNVIYVYGLIQRI